MKFRLHIPLPCKNLTKSFLLYFCSPLFLSARFQKGSATLTVLNLHGKTAEFGILSERWKVKSIRYFRISKKHASFVREAGLKFRMTRKCRKSFRQFLVLWEKKHRSGIAANICAWPRKTWGQPRIDLKTSHHACHLRPRKRNIFMLEKRRTSSRIWSPFDISVDENMQETFPVASPHELGVPTYFSLMLPFPFWKFNKP